MARMKNVSFEVLAAIKGDLKTEIVFQPQEEKEVPDKEVERFIERYPNHLVVIKPEVVEPVKSEDQSQAEPPQETIVDEDLIVEEEPREEVIVANKHPKKKK